ncbi:unnamed protein product, partial [Closterium sp. Naga37s-1]
MSAAAASLLVACLIAAAAGSVRAASSVAVNGGAVVDGYVRLDGSAAPICPSPNTPFPTATLPPCTHTLQVAVPLESTSLLAQSLLSHLTCFLPYPVVPRSAFRARTQRSALSPGAHTLQVSAPGAFFLPVTLQVSAKHAGNFRAMVIREQGPASLSIDPLIISPFAAEEYFERRQPFSIWTIVKSPMGIMICFMLVVMVVLPRLADSI